jgi:hypothetical protein
MLLREQADFDLAVKLRQGTATIGEIYTFMSGLYFRGKMAYAEAFRAAPPGIPPGVVIVPGVGLVPPETAVDVGQLRTVADVPVDEGNHVYRSALLRAARLLDEYAGSACSYVLLGSIASGKYTGRSLRFLASASCFPPILSAAAI